MYALGNGSDVQSILRRKR